ncbi:septum formation initiator family protein [Actinoplanes sp. NEAU-A12]|uniref:Septum formation initiator family protein n=1 Tax=Actinoplanes sandaracinus TaxID=3045177 RepID=A0ABT6WFB7_9ACTN|nr:septum formation initiator family protein [Actinoplanes sandaracinus]MDI6098404.1 septum formation initiator family protein [Actinoplanes sandaracinus]
MTERRTPSGQGPSRRRTGAGGRPAPVRTRDTTARARVASSRTRNTGPVRAPSARRAAGGSSGGGTSAERTDAPRPSALTSRATVVFALLITLALAYTYPLRVYLEQESRIAEMKQAAADQRARIAEAAKELENWNDPEYLRIQARERQQYVRPGEAPLVVVEYDEERAGSTAAPAPAAAPDRWYDTLWSSVQAAGTESPGTESPGTESSDTEPSTAKPQD